jgi:hypothetical protein
MLLNGIEPGQHGATIGNVIRGIATARCDLRNETWSRREESHRPASPSVDLQVQVQMRNSDL